MIRAASIVLLSLCLFGAVTAKSPLSFRLDDIQCGWMELNQRAIVETFMKWKVPITLGVITGPGDCMTGWLNPLLAKYPRLIEIASHSKSHLQLRNTSTDFLKQEIADSRAHLQLLFPKQNIKMFIPPLNSWDMNVVTAMREAGYTTFSAQCSPDIMLGAQNVPNYLCTTTMYPSVPYPYFQPLDGLYHIPIGTSLIDFFHPGVLLTPDQVMNSPIDLCRPELAATARGPCSILANLNANIGRMYPDSNTWAAVMMHPDDFSDPTIATTYLDTLLPQLMNTYDMYTMSDIVLAVNGSINTSVYNGTSTKTYDNAAGLTMPSSLLFLSAVGAIITMFWVSK